MRSVFRSGLAAVFAAACAASLIAASSASAQGAAEPAPIAAYGALPSMEMVKLSPSGSKIAFVTVSGEDRLLVLLDLTTRAQIGGVGVGRAKVRDLEWIGEDRVLVTTTKTETIPRLGMVNAELATGQIYDPGKNRLVTMLANTRDLFPALFSDVGVVNNNGPQVLVRAYAFGNPDRLDLFRVNLETGRAALSEVMGLNVTDFILDESGQSVARSEYDARAQVWSLYLRQGSTFRKVWDTTAPIDTPNILGLGINGQSVIVAADRPDLSQPGRPDAEFFDVNMTSGAWRAVRFEFMPDRLFFHPVTGRMIGARRLTNEGPIYAFADEQARALSDTIQQTFAGQGASIVGWSDNFRQAVVYTGSDRDSGTYRVLDLDSATVVPVGGSYASITPDRVAQVRPVGYDAADGLFIQGYLTLPPGREDARGLPLVVLPHGGPASRDVRTFDYWAQALASRGYAVLQPNFRGSTGYGDAFMEAGYGEWGKKMQTDLSDGVRYLAAEGIIDPARVCIVGASYGGYAALAGATLDLGVYRCAVSVAGPSDLRIMVDDEASRGARRENATTRYWNRFMGAERLGDRSLDERSPARLADRVTVPILLIHGRDDSVVPIEQSRLMERALRRAGKPVEFVELTGEDHWLSRGETRTRMLTETLRFLEAHNPAN